MDLHRELRELIATTARGLGFTLDAGLLPFGVKGPHAREIRRLSKVVGKEILPLDLLVLPSFLEDVWLSRENFEWEGRRLKVVSAEGLATMKRIAGRAQDKADLERLLGTDDD
jgi:hypothetical protein